MKTELLDAYLSGELRGESAAFIEAALKSDAALREVYFQQARMDAALRVLLEDEELVEVPPARFAAAVMARLASEAAPASGRSRDRRLARSVLLEILEDKSVRPRPLGWLEWAKAAGIAAAAAALMVLALRSVSVTETAPTDGRGGESRSQFVARVSAEEAGTVWGADSSREPARGAAPDFAARTADGWLRPGKLVLEAGVAEITFNSGARVFLEGPAVLEVERPNRAYLERGRLTAEVPPAASGFVINTPRVNVVDIGTRFGVSVEEDGDTEVHVMQGLVEVSRLSGSASPLLVEEGLAVRADARTRSQLRFIGYAGDTFALKVGGAEAEAQPAFVWYCFDESGGPEIEDRGRGMEGGPYHGSLFPGTSQQPRPKRSLGKWGGGLAFSPGERFESPRFAPWDPGSSLSAALWVRVPPRPSNGGASALLSLVAESEESPSDSGSGTVAPRWSLGWNADPDDGVAGALRVETGEAWVVGSTDLRDGRWHHVGFRFIGGEPGAAVSRLHLYVDGQLEAASGYRDGQPDEAPFHRLQIGALPGGPSFEGAVDEVFLFPAAVSPGVMQRLAAGDGKM